MSYVPYLAWVFSSNPSTIPDEYGSSNVLADHTSMDVFSPF
jgi:hypothetical protein